MVLAYHPVVGGHSNFRTGVSRVLYSAGHCTLDFMPAKSLTYSPRQVMNSFLSAPGMQDLMTLLNTVTLLISTLEPTQVHGTAQGVHQIEVC